MDPNANLEAIRRCIHAMRETASAKKRAEYADRLADLTEALDEWISSGGFLPRSWERDQ